MRIAMIGTGYVGLVSGACFADFGHQVTCVDKDAGKIDALRRGEIPIFEPGLDALVASNVKANRLDFTTDLTAPVAQLRDANETGEIAGRRLLLIGGEAAALLLAFAVLFGAIGILFAAPLSVVTNVLIKRLYVREALVVSEWTATATHPDGRILEWDGVDIFPFEDGLIRRKDVYSGSANARVIGRAVENEVAREP